MTREEIRAKASRAVSAYEEAKKMFPELFAIVGAVPVDPMRDAVEVSQDYLRLTEPPEWQDKPDSDGPWWCVMENGEVEPGFVVLGGVLSKVYFYERLGLSPYVSDHKGPWLKAEEPTPPKKES